MDLPGGHLDDIHPPSVVHVLLRNNNDARGVAGSGNGNGGYYGCDDEPASPIPDDYSPLSSPRNSPLCPPPSPSAGRGTMKRSPLPMMTMPQRGEQEGEHDLAKEEPAVLLDCCSAPSFDRPPPAEAMPQAPAPAPAAPFDEEERPVPPQSYSSSPGAVGAEKWHQRSEKQAGTPSDPSHQHQRQGEEWITGHQQQHQHQNRGCGDEVSQQKRLLLLGRQLGTSSRTTTSRQRQHHHHHHHRQQQQQPTDDLLDLPDLCLAPTDERRIVGCPSRGSSASSSSSSSSTRSVGTGGGGGGEEEEEKARPVTRPATRPSTIGAVPASSRARISPPPTLPPAGNDELPAAIGDPEEELAEYRKRWIPMKPPASSSPGGSSENRPFPSSSKSPKAPVPSDGPAFGRHSHPESPTIGRAAGLGHRRPRSPSIERLVRKYECLRRQRSDSVDGGDCDDVSSLDRGVAVVSAKGADEKTGSPMVDCKEPASPWGSSASSGQLQRSRPPLTSAVGSAKPHDEKNDLDNDIPRIRASLPSKVAASSPSDNGANRCPSTPALSVGGGSVAATTSRTATSAASGGGAVIANSPATVAVAAGTAPHGTSLRRPPSSRTAAGVASELFDLAVSAVAAAGTSQLPPPPGRGAPSNTSTATAVPADPPAWQPFEEDGCVDDVCDWSSKNRGKAGNATELGGSEHKSEGGWWEEDELQRGGCGEDLRYPEIAKTRIVGVVERKETPQSLPRASTLPEGKPDQSSTPSPEEHHQKQQQNTPFYSQRLPLDPPSSSGNIDHQKMSTGVNTTPDAPIHPTTFVTPSPPVADSPPVVRRLHHVRENPEASPYFATPAVGSTAPHSLSDTVDTRKRDAPAVFKNGLGDSYNDDCDGTSESTGTLIESLDAMIQDLDLKQQRLHVRSASLDGCSFSSGAARGIVVDNAAHPSSCRVIQQLHHRQSQQPQRQRMPTYDSATPPSCTATTTGSSEIAHSDSTALGYPALVKPLDNDIGIPKGDIVLSLLSNGNREAAPGNGSARKAAQAVYEAVWRCRTMRRNCDTQWLQDKAHRKPGAPSKGRTSICIDIDEGRVSGGLDSLMCTQRAALEHLKYDDFEEALVLFHDILQTYDSYFEHAFNNVSVDGNNSPRQREADVQGCKLFVGVALHNIGVIHLLLGEFQSAFTYFERATLNRASSLGTAHSDYISSLVKMSICRYALEDFPSSHKGFEEALSLARGNNNSLADHRQVAEILNNIACLSYMRGQTEKAMELLEQSMDAQNFASDKSLYAGSRFSGHTASLNSSVTKANMGVVGLVTQDLSVSITALEASLRDQQLLLRDASVTLISTMEYLVVATLMSGQKEKALQLLNRMLHMQVDAFGRKDPRCLRTESKIKNLRSDAKRNGKTSATTLDEALGAMASISGDAKPNDKTSKRFRPFKSMRKKQSNAA